MINYWQPGVTLDIGPYPKNKRMQFSPLDSDNIDNWKKVKDKGEWTADSFDYKYNAQGFRSDWDFDLAIDKPILLGLGCSHTVGVGIPQEQSWIHQLGNNHMHDHMVWNAGQGGGSADTVARLAVNIIPIARPKTVAILWPSLYRFETYEKYIPTMQGPWNMEGVNLQYEDQTIYNNQCKNKTIVKLLQEIYHFKLLELNVDDINYLEIFPLARDGHHNGAEWNSRVQEDMWEKHK